MSDPEKTPGYDWVTCRPHMAVAPDKGPTVSIVLPIYNAGHLLRPQVDSILNQTYPSWELFLVDDGSTDESPLIAQEYAARSPSVHFRKNDVNRGLITTVNEAIAQTSGDLVALSDHDDIWLPEKIARQVAYLSKHRAVECVFSDRAVIDLEGRLLCASEYTRTGKPPEVADTAFLLATMALHTHANTLMFRRSLVEMAFPIPRGWDWWIAAVASLRGQIGFMRDQLVLYRVYEGSVSSSQLLYVKGTHSRTTREQVHETVRRHYEDLSSLRKRACQLSDLNPPLLLIDRWWRWYGMLLKLLSRPSWQGYRSALTTLPKADRWSHLLEATLYACPTLHRAYLRLAAQLRGY